MIDLRMYEQTNNYKLEIKNYSVLIYWLSTGYRLHIFVKFIFIHTLKLV